MFSGTTNSAGTKNGSIGCNYIMIVGTSRHCKVEDCDKFIEGTRIRLKKSDVFYTEKELKAEIEKNRRK